jgi:hypothetical protein
LSEFLSGEEEEEEEDDDESAEDINKRNIRQPTVRLRRAELEEPAALEIKARLPDGRI